MGTHLRKRWRGSKMEATLRATGGRLIAFAILEKGTSKLGYVLLLDVARRSKMNANFRATGGRLIA
jgi:hypothetical protein